VLFFPYVRWGYRNDDALLMRTPRHRGFDVTPVVPAGHAVVGPIIRRQFALRCFPPDLFPRLLIHVCDRNRHEEFAFVELRNGRVRLRSRRSCVPHAAVHEHVMVWRSPYVADADGGDGGDGRSSAAGVTGRASSVDSGSVSDRLRAPLSPGVGSQSSSSGGDSDSDEECVAAPSAVSFMGGGCVNVMAWHTVHHDHATTTERWTGSDAEPRLLHSGMGMWRVFEKVLIVWRDELLRTYIQRPQHAVVPR
jgi:hypothetical protein